MAEINSFTGLRTIEVASGEDMHPANNLGELRSPATALVNLGLTSDKNELNLLDAVPATVTIALAASATTDGMDITITAKDASGATLAAACELHLWMSESSAGLGLTGDAYSGDLTAGTGKILGTLTSKKCWLIQTHTTGVFVGTLVDSANPADQYAVVKKPHAAGRVVSAVSGTNWEGAA